MVLALFVIWKLEKWENSFFTCFWEEIVILFKNINILAVHMTLLRHGKAGMDSRIAGILLILLWICSGVSLGVSQKDAEQAEQQLEQLRKEIQEYESKISKSQSRERNLLQELDDFNREIELRFTLLRQLEAEKQRVVTSMGKIGREIETLQVEIVRISHDSSLVAQERDSLISLINRRSVYTYKYFNRDALRAILTSRTLVQMLVQQEYIKRISEADRSNIMLLSQKNQKLNQINSQLISQKAAKSNRLGELRRTADYKNRLISEENSETELLKARSSDRGKILKRIRSDQDLLRQQLNEKKLAAQRIENLIQSLETKRENLPVVPEVAWAPEVPFSQLKGSLNWPTAGKIVSKFGLQRHKTLATVTENPGIEIEAKEDTPVLVVCTGQVTKITWMRGYGNTVIVDHRDGYYTVYAHLGAIYAGEGHIVEAGDMIGRVGQSGSLEGPRLHFEIWVQREKQDPLGWLIDR